MKKSEQGGPAGDCPTQRQDIAKSTDAQATVLIAYDVTVDDKALTERCRASQYSNRQRRRRLRSAKTSHFSRGEPGLYVFLSVFPHNQDPAKAAPNHNPRFSLMRVLSSSVPERLAFWQ